MTDKRKITHDIKNRERRLVIIAGAGISLDPPSNLPDWWAFNKSIIDEVKAQAISLCPEAKEIIDGISIESHFPVQCLSDLLVREGAGASYFPLLKGLDSYIPNANHIALAKLAKEKRISAIITTNFDMLIERAFEKEAVPLNKIIEENDYSKVRESKECALYKIHGSVNNAETLIDTVTQKAQGIALYKRTAIEKEMLGKDIVFLGFSGADYDFNKDYIPIAKALQNGSSIMWVVHPGAHVRDFVKELEKEYPTQVRIVEENLRDFFEEYGIDYTGMDAGLCSAENKEPARDLRESIKELFSGPHLGLHGCMGYCLSLLRRMGKKTELLQLMDIYSKRFDVEKIDAYGIVGINALAVAYFYMGKFEDSIRFFQLVMFCMDAMQKEFASIPDSTDIPKELVNSVAKEGCVTIGTAGLNIAVALFYMNDLETAKRYLNEAHRLLGVDENSVSFCMVEFLENRIDYREKGNHDDYEKRLKCIIDNLVKIGGLENATELLLQEADMLVEAEKYEEAKELLDVANQYLKNVGSYNLQIEGLRLNAICGNALGNVEETKKNLNNMVTQIIRFQDEERARKMIDILVSSYPFDKTMHDQLLELGKICDISFDFLYRVPIGDFLERNGE